MNNKKIPANNSNIGWYFFLIRIQLIFENLSLTTPQFIKFQNAEI